MPRVRLQRFLAQAGIASRRKSEDLISAGLIRVNGRLVTEPGTTVDPEADEVLLIAHGATAQNAHDGFAAIGLLGVREHLD